MEFSIVKLFPDNFIQALCNTLLHSLWQGVILSVVTAVIIISTRKSSPARRYNLLIAALVLFAAGTIVTFIISLKHKPAYVTTAVKYNGGVIVNTPSAPVVIYETALPPATFKDKAINYFNSNSATIVLIWFLIVCARCLQLATGLQGVYYLRRRSIFTADELWRKRVQQLADELGIRRAVKIAESGLAKVPMVVGHLKPLILIPVGLLTAMSAEEIEAILVHELAHIRRSDYLVNLLQNLLEIIFFFNPAVLWLSSLIKTERENCCDDIAVSQSSNKVNYIKALVACQEYNRQPSSALAMALNGKNTPLKTRVTRIISNNNQSLNRMEKAFLAICLVTAGLCTAAFTNAEKINKLVANTAKAIKKEILPENKPGKVNELKTPAPADTTSKHGPKIYSSNQVGDHTSVTFQNGAYTTKLYKEKGVLYQFNYRKGTLASMQVDGKNIPEKDFARYEAIIDQVPHDTETQYGEIHDAADDRANVADNHTMSQTDSAIQLYKASASLGKLDGKLDRLDVQQQKLARQTLFRTDSAGDNGIFAKKPVGYKAQPIPSKRENRDERMIMELISDRIIKSRDKLSFKISTKEFIVNSKRQPDDIFQKYKAEFVQEISNANGSWAWMYNFDSDAKVTDATPALYDQQKSLYSRKAIDYKSYVSLKDDERRDKMISELMIDGIIGSKNNLSFKISTSEFIVNGKKQADDVYQKYKSRFVKNTTGVWSWTYNYDDAARRESNTVVDEPNQH